MSIPQARAILEAALHHAKSEHEFKYAVMQAIPLMFRRKPDFVAKKKIPKLTAEQKRAAKRLRSKGLSINDIARALGTNHGRVSEAINPPKKERRP